MNDIEMKELVEEEQSLSLIEKAVCMITDPKKGFDAMKSKPKVLGIYLLIALLSMSTLIWTFLDGSMKQIIIDQMISTGQGVDEQVLQIGVIAGIIGGSIAILILPLIQGLFYHIIAMIQGKTGYKKTLVVILYAGIITGLGGLLSTVISKVSGSTFVFSFAQFLDPVTTSRLVYTLASMLNLFSIWSMVVLYIGFRSLHEMNKKEAIITTIAPTLLSIALSVGVVLMTK